MLNLHKPTEPYDAVTKDYVDYVKSILNESLVRLNELYISINRTQEEIKEKFKKRTHIIAIHASYHVDLIRGEYQFTFGGSKNKNTGFLIPHSGRIKKINAKIYHDEGNGNIHNINLPPWTNILKPDPIFTFT